MAGPAESVRLPKVRSQHLLPSLDRAVKFKKRRRAHDKYVRPKAWKLVRQYRTCIRARFDAEDIKFYIYEKALQIDGTDLSQNVNQAG